MSTLIATSSALFLTTTGFTYGSLVTWAGNNVLLMLGGGLGLIDAMMGWIIAAVIVGAILGLLYKGLRFFHVIR
jgi:hypothetical protein